jgi:hypothetical protein
MTVRETFKQSSVKNARRSHGIEQNGNAFTSKKLNGRDKTGHIILDEDGKPMTPRRHLEVALKHNLREIVADRGPYGNIDPCKIACNYILHGSDTSVAAMADAAQIVSTADTRGRKLRSDTLWGIEVVFTALPRADADLRSYFADCTKWAAEAFKVPVLSSVVHLDQGAPHCHVLLVPLIAGKMNGGKVYGHWPKLVARLSSFHEAVGKRYGLNLARLKKKLPPSERKTLLQRCADYLSDGPRLTGHQIETILKAFRDDPSPLAACFDVVKGGRRVERNSFTDRMTRAA